MFNSCLDARERTRVHSSGICIRRQIRPFPTETSSCAQNAPIQSILRRQLASSALSLDLTVDLSPISRADGPLLSPLPRLIRRLCLHNTPKSRSRAAYPADQQAETGAPSGSVLMGVAATRLADLPPLCLHPGELDLEMRGAEGSRRQVNTCGQCCPISLVISTNTPGITHRQY